MPSTGPEGPGGAALQVAVGVIRDGYGRVLIARRPETAHQGGLWEFPGGKIAAGESVDAALARELEEELGIRPLETRPLLRIPFSYPGRRVCLDTREVVRFAGDPVGREGQPLRWVAPEALPGYAFPAANAPIVNALRLPDRYLITPPLGDGAPEACLATLRARLADGVRLVQLRLPGTDPGQRAAIAREAAALCRAADAALLVNGDPALAGRLGVGVHLRASQLQTHTERPCGPDGWFGASCHDAAELARAAALGADFAVLGPVHPTTTHPDAVPMGMDGFAGRVADCPLPVYALGGLGLADLAAVRAAGGQGVAAIRGLWDAAGPVASR